MVLNMIVRIFFLIGFEDKIFFLGVFEGYMYVC